MPTSVLELAELLQEEQLQRLADRLKGQSAEGLASTLLANRVAFLSKLKACGVERLGERQKLANALSKAVKAGRVAQTKAIPHLVRCSWSQTDEAVTVRMLIPGGTPSRRIRCSFDVNSVQTFVDGESASFTGRLTEVIKPLDSVWEIERAPASEPTAYASEASREVADDVLVATLSKAHPREWKSLFQGGDGAPARQLREAEPKPPTPTPPPRTTAQPHPPGSGGPLKFVPRKLVLGGPEAHGRAARKSSRDAARPDNGTQDSVPARDHWQSASARYLWPSGLAEVAGAPDAPEGEPPFFRWVESSGEVLLSASTRQGIGLDEITLDARPTSAEVLINGASSPWCGALAGKVDPARCEVRVVPQSTGLTDTLEIRLAKADARFWRAPFKDLLPVVEEQDKRRQLPQRASVSDELSWSSAQHSSSWQIRVPVLWSKFESGDLIASDLRVGVTKKSINVHIAGQEDSPLLGAELMGSIVPAKCSWRLRSPPPGGKHGEVDIELQKEPSESGAFGFWKDLIKVWYV